MDSPGDGSNASSGGHPSSRPDLRSAALTPHAYPLAQGGAATSRGTPFPGRGQHHHLMADGGTPPQGPALQEDAMSEGVGADGQEEVEEQQLEPDQEQQEPAEEEQMTGNIHSGIVSMHQRRAAIEQQVDDLTEAGVQFLDKMKAAWQQRMATLKSNVAQGCAGQEATWRHVNTQTQEALQRLGAAQQLVRSLGLGATGSGSGDV